MDSQVARRKYVHYSRSQGIVAKLHTSRSEELCTNGIASNIL
jgi:hypothetical protein